MGGAGKIMIHIDLNILDILLAKYMYIQFCQNSMQNLMPRICGAYLVPYTGKYRKARPQSWHNLEYISIYFRPETTCHKCMT